jgi:hypothetical protein
MAIGSVGEHRLATARPEEAEEHPLVAGLAQAFLQAAA